MASMKAWCFDHYGPPAVMQIQERAIPIPGPGELLIKIAASAINPSDVKNVAGWFNSRTPRVPGRDYAGLVVAGDRQGEEVWGSGAGFGVTRDGAHAEYAVLPSAGVAGKPADLSWPQAAAAGVPYVTAWSALVTQGQVQAGETVLVTGASGAVGRAATQIAHWKRARVIGADRSRDNPSGADATIDTRSQSLADEVKALTGGHGADLALDAVGGSLFEPCLSALRHGGRQVAIASHPAVVSFNLVDFYHGTKHLIGLDTLALTDQDIAGVMDHLRTGFQLGVLQPPPIQTWPFARAVDAYEAVAKGGSRARHVLLME
jgi:NADPH:quinone reductase